MTSILSLCAFVPSVVPRCTRSTWLPLSLRRPARFNLPRPLLPCRVSITRASASHSQAGNAVPVESEDTASLSSSSSSQPIPSATYIMRARSLLLGKPAIILLSLALLALALARAGTLPAARDLVSAATAHARTLGTWHATLLLVATNFCTVLLCFPANMGLMITAGAVLPPLHAFAALYVSKLCAASVSFLLARSLLHAPAQRYLEGHPRLRAVLAQAGGSAGWRFVVVMRLSPFPGFLLNYMLSLTTLSFRQYAIGTALGIAPSIANLVLIGAAAKEVSVGVVRGGLAVTWLSLSIKLLCVASMLVVSVVVTRAVGKAFRDAEGVDIPDDNMSLEDDDATQLHV